MVGANNEPEPSQGRIAAKGGDFFTDGVSRGPDHTSIIVIRCPSLPPSTPRTPSSQLHLDGRRIGVHGTVLCENHTNMRVIIPDGYRERYNLKGYYAPDRSVALGSIVPA